jgi:hypothetical protein
MKRLLLSILAILILVEEWLWDVLTLLGNLLVVWLHLESFERWLAQANPMVALATMILPVGLVLPVEFFALMLISHGQLDLGLGLLITGKLLATLLVSRMFAIARSQLLTIAWFFALYSMVTRWLNWAHELVRATTVYQQTVRIKQAAKAKLASWLETGK